MIILMIAMLFQTDQIFGQVYQMWKPNSERPTLSINYQKAFFKHDEWSTYTGLSGIVHIDGSFPLGSGWELQAQLPVVIVRMKDYSEINTIGLGNIFLATQKCIGAQKTSFLALGVYIPTIGDNSYDRPFVGLLSDYYHLLKYMPRTTSVTLNYAYHHTVEHFGFIYGLEIGPDIAIPTGRDGDTEIYAHYAAKGGFQLSNLAVWSELTGDILLTEEGNLSDKMNNCLTFGAELNYPKVRPGIFYSIYLDSELREFVPSVLGIKADISF